MLFPEVVERSNWLGAREAREKSGTARVGGSIGESTLSARVGGEHTHTHTHTHTGVHLGRSDVTSGTNDPERCNDLRQMAQELATGLEEARLVSTHTWHWGERRVAHLTT